MARGDDLIQHLLGRGCRNGEADAFGTGCLADQEGIDANQFTLGIDQGTAGVAEIDRRVGLNEILGAGTVQLPPNGADDAHGHGLVETQWISDRQHHVTGTRRLAGHADDRKIAGIDLQHGQIRLRIRADQGRLGDAAVVQQHLDVGSMGNDVIVGQHITLALGADDDAGAKSLLAMLEGGRLAAEQLLQDRVVVHLYGLLGDDLVGIDVHH